MCFIFLLFAGLAYLFYSEANNLKDFMIRYDDKCPTPRMGKDCEITFTLDVDMSNPKVYYRLDNFYQNHRSF